LSDQGQRAFVALELDHALRERLARAVAEACSGIPGLRLVAADNIHLTLRFLGPSQPHQLQALEPPLAAAARESPPIGARFAGAGMFPERGSPNVLWVGLRTQPDLLPLQQACERAACGAGFAPERRPFRPHLTVGRFRERLRERPKLPPLELGDTTLERLVLFRSELHPERARHTPLASFALGGRV
jgi:2'-5' RNA ligase